MKRLLECLAARRKLMRVFPLICDYQPLIHDVSIMPGFTRYTFTIPNGMNPKVLYDKLFAFHQVLGENMTLTGSTKRFTLTVYRKSIPSEVKYKQADWLEVTEDMELPVIIGIDQLSKKIAYDLAKQPHALLAGETGSGKSSLLRSILTHLMLTRTPDQVQFILGDLKRSEFGLFRHMPHVRGVHVVIDDLAQALLEVKIEMERRGSLLDDAEVPHIKDLKQPLPYLIIAIDEVALLRTEKKIMAIIEDISSVGRSLGCLLLLSLQRPDIKVLDGRLRNNLTTRISGRQSDATNAKVAGVPGAERINKNDRGRMIYVADEPIMFQAPWLPFDEAKKLLNPLKQPKRPRKKVFDAEPAVVPPQQYSFGLLGGGNNAPE